MVEFYSVFSFAAMSLLFGIIQDRRSLIDHLLWDIIRCADACKWPQTGE